MDKLYPYMIDKRLELLDGELEYGTINEDGDGACTDAYIERKREQFRHEFFDFWEGDDAYND